MLERSGRAIEGLNAVVSGSGNVALYAIEKIQQLGGTAITASDSSGYVVDEKGIDLDLLKQVKEVERLRVSDYAERRPGAHFVRAGSVWDVPTDIALPCATQNELDGAAAATLVRQGVTAVAEGANMPCTPEAIEAFRESSVLFAPGKAANAGGVATSALEMSQNASRQRWSFADSEDRLRAIMTSVHDMTYESSERHGARGDYVIGANTASFVKVADAMLAQGVI